MCQYVRPLRPLRLLCSRSDNSMQLAMFLIDAGAMARKCEPSQRTMLEFAMDYGHGAAGQHSLQVELWDALETGDCARLRAALFHGATYPCTSAGCVPPSSGMHPVTRAPASAPYRRKGQAARECAPWRSAARCAAPCQPLRTNAASLFLQAQRSVRLMRNAALRSPGPSHSDYPSRCPLSRAHSSHSFPFRACNMVGAM
jgi:hypothetical protein